MDRRGAGQGAEEKALEGYKPWAVKHLPTLVRHFAATDPDTKSWMVGARGERRAARIVERIIAKVGGELVCDVQLDNENVDLVAVLPTGLFILEVKHWSGRANLKGEVIFHGGRHPRRVHAQVERQRRKLAAQLGLAMPIEGVIVLVPNGKLVVSGSADPTTTPVVMLRDLERHLLGTRAKRRPQVLKPYEVAGLAVTVRMGRRLDAQLTEGG